METLESSSAGKLSTDVMERAKEKLSNTATTLSRTGGEIAERAGSFYKQHPRKIQALGLLAAAALLVGLKRRGSV